VLKPKNRSSAKGVRYFYDQDKYFEYLRTLENAEDYVIQEFVPGEGVGYSVYSQNGIILEGFGHRRIAEYPVTGGSSVYREEYQNPNMIKIVKTLLERVKWSGFAMFEFKKTENGELYLIEVNPRIWGSINQGLQNGINYFSHLLKEPVDIEKHQRIRTYLPPLIYLSLWQYLWKGRIRVVWEFIKSFPKNRSDLKLWSDPLGYLSVALRAVS
jgi:predicted ATP-grasp superfamily ATP-dependent carboligase